MMLIVGTDEVWFSDTSQLAKKVTKAGGVAKIEIFEGMWHCFPMQLDMPEAEKALETIAEFVDL